MTTQSARRMRSLTLTALIGTFAGAAVADEGMWLFDRPPTQQLKERYGFEPKPEWMEHLRKSSVRFSLGGSASIVSSKGLVMTNHHVGYDMLEQLSTPDRDLAASGFYARTPEEELKCDGAEAMVLWNIEDVTARVTASVKPEMTLAQAAAARRAVMAEIEQEAEDKTKLDCQVVTLYHGAMYHLYSYKRFDDVRLVMAPEEAAANFGGDTDNFEYPRFCLDMCFFRIYENGQPLKPEHYLKWSRSGAAENDLVFVSGHPGRTQRLFTVDHLKFLRDVELPARLQSLWRMEVQLRGFAARSKENARIASGDLLGVQNGRKAITGVLAGLQDPVLMQAKPDAETKLRAAVDANPEWKKHWGDAWSQITAARDEHRKFAVRQRWRPGGELFNIALHIVRLNTERTRPSGERLREYRDSELDSLFLDLYSTAPIYEDYEIFRLASSLAHLEELFGGDDPEVTIALGSQSPRARAEGLVRGTKLKDVAERRRLAEAGPADIESSTDPMIQFARALDPTMRNLRRRYEDAVEPVDRIAYASVAAAEFATLGETQYPDATFTLRLAYGPVKGYTENGKPVPPFTTLGGTYQRAAERAGEAEFQLSERWIKGKDKLDLSTPYNFVCTADIIGGNSGSPVVDRAGDVVGLIFDGNLQSLPCDFAYDDVAARAVAVDARAIIETLRKLYDASALVDELMGK